MKQIFRIRIAVALTAFLALIVLVPGGVVSPPSVAAAACIEPSTDSQLAAQELCIAAYIDVCKESYSDKICDNLTLSQINNCAVDGQEKRLVPNCMQDIQDAATRADSESTNRIEPKKNDCKAANSAALSKDNCGIIAMIVVITNVLAGVAAIIIVAAFIWGGILYSMAGSDPNKVGAAKDRIFKALTALLLLIFGYAILQWLTPGGIL